MLQNFKKYTESRAMPVNAKFRKDSNTVICPQFLQCSVEESYLHAVSPQTTICKIRPPCKMGYELEGRNSSKKSINNLCRCNNSTLCYPVRLIFRSCSTSVQHRPSQSCTYPAMSTFSLRTCIFRK